MISRGRRGILVLAWFHPLMDARGGQNLLAHLNHADSGIALGWRVSSPLGPKKAGGR